MMKKSQFTEEQITFALRQADSGMKVPQICWRQLSASLPRCPFMIMDFDFPLADAILDGRPRYAPRFTRTASRSVEPVAQSPVPSSSGCCDTATHRRDATRPRPRLTPHAPCLDPRPPTAYRPASPGSVSAQFRT